MLNTVQKALEQDAASQCRKYNGSNEPNGCSARFSVQLPRSPQHLRYSCLGRATSPGGALGSNDSSEASPSGSNSSPGVDSCASTTAPAHGDGRQPFRSTKETLFRWFRELDRAGSGLITRRELVVALRRRPEYLDAMCSGAAAPASAALPGHSEQLEEDRGREWLRAGMLRVRQILREIDADSCGAIAWSGFVDFFRRAGLLLEYQEDELSISKSPFVAEVEVSRPNTAPTECHDVSLSVEIRTRIGPQASARFALHQRATSPIDVADGEEIASARRERRSGRKHLESRAV